MKTDMLDMLQALLDTHKKMEVLYQRNTDRLSVCISALSKIDKVMESDSSPNNALALIHSHLAVANAELAKFRNEEE